MRIINKLTGEYYPHRTLNGFILNLLQKEGCNCKKLPHNGYICVNCFFKMNLKIIPLYDKLNFISDRNVEIDTKVTKKDVNKAGLPYTGDFCDVCGKSCHAVLYTIVPGLKCCDKCKRGI